MSILKKITLLAAVLVSFAALLYYFKPTSPTLEKHTNRETPSNSSGLAQNPVNDPNSINSTLTTDNLQAAKNKKTEYHLKAQAQAFTSGSAVQKLKADDPKKVELRSQTYASLASITDGMSRGKTADLTEVNELISQMALLTAEGYIPKQSALNHLAFLKKAFPKLNVEIDTHIAAINAPH